MAKYIGTILTNKGKDLLAKAILGETMVFTKVKLGKGVLHLGEDKETLTALADSFKTLSITSTLKLSNGGYRIRVSFNNKGLIDDTYLREIGVYAKGKDGIEVLYSYCNTDTPNLLPNESSGKIEVVEDIITYISSAATITAVIDQSNIYATIKDLVEGLATKENKFTKNSGWNKSFGTTSGTVMEGNKRAVDLGGEAAFTKKDAFNKSFSHVINSTSKILVASAYAVKLAYDKGAAALLKATSAQSTANSAQTKANSAYSLASGKEPKINKGNAFNKNFGTTSGTVMEGNKRATDLGGEAAFTKKDAFNKSFSHVINSTSKILVASAYAVKLAYDKGAAALLKATSAQLTANSAQTKANSAYSLASGKEPKFNKGNAFNKSFSHVINSTSKTLVASAYAVKLAYDRGTSGITKANAAQSKANSAYSVATAALPKAGGTMTGNLVGISSRTISGFGKVYNAIWNDYAEFFEKENKEKGEPGDIVMLDIEASKERYIVCTEETSSLAIGVITDECAHLIGGRDVKEGIDFFDDNLKDHFPIGLAGRVRPKIAGAIDKGDHIVSSRLKGIGRKYIEEEDPILAIIGMALETKKTEDIKRVRMLIKK